MLIQWGNLIESGTTYNFSQPTLSSNGTVGGNSFAVFCSSYESYYSSRNAYAAFDRVYDSGGWFCSNSIPCFIGWYNPTALRVTKVHITNSIQDYNYTCKSGYLQYSYNGTDWYNLQAFTGTVGSLATWDINVTNPVTAKYYRLHITDRYTNTVSIGEIDITGTYVMSTGSASVQFPVSYTNNYSIGLSSLGSSLWNIYLTQKQTTGFSVVNPDAAKINYLTIGY